MSATPAVVRTAGDVLALVGGAENVAVVSHCFSRLRLELHDDALADDEALQLLPQVVLVVRQGGQLQVALAADLLAVHDEVRAQVARHAG